VGLFLVIVIGASIVAFSPRNHSAIESARADSALRGYGQSAIAPAVIGNYSQSAAPIELLPPPVPPPNPVRSDDVAYNRPENVIYINGENSDSAVKVERLREGNTNTYITIQQPVKTQSDDVSFEKPIATQAKLDARPEARPATKTETSVTKPPAKSTANKRNDYWVQAGSFATKSHADNAKTFLAGKGIGSIVLDSNVSGKVVYRVRIGPYTTQSEANYWLSLVKEIDGMHDSLIWKSPAKM
jgi:cell division protein FtsN